MPGCAGGASPREPPVPPCTRSLSATTTSPPRGASLHRRRVPCSVRATAHTPSSGRRRLRLRELSRAPASAPPHLQDDYARGLTPRPRPTTTHQTTGTRLVHRHAPRRRRRGSVGRALVKSWIGHVVPRSPPTKKSRRLDASCINPTRTQQVRQAAPQGRGHSVHRDDEDQGDGLAPARGAQATVLAGMTLADHAAGHPRRRR